MAEFNIAELMKGVSRADTGREQISYLPHGQIYEDAANGYSMDDIEELARSIEIVGLQQPLRVRPIEGLADGYRIISGHRRFAAVTQLIEQGSQRFADGVPCIIDSAAASDALRELQLILGNADNRKLTAADELQQTERISDCLRRLEDEGYQFPGRHRDWVSKLSGLSRSKIGRLDAIKKNLIPALFDRFNEGLLGVTTAYRISQEEQGIQIALFRQCGGIHSYGLLNSLNEQELENEIAKCKAPPQKEPPQATPAPVSFDAESYLAERAREDEQFYSWLTETAKTFLLELEGTETRQSGIEKLKRRFGSSRRNSSGPNMVCYESAPKGLRLSHSSDRRETIFRTWTEVYDMLCLIALNRVATGEGFDEDDEDDEPEEEAPTVRWESRAITPPQREPVLLYQSTNAGPKFTPAVYCGGAVFCKPAWRAQTGTELTGIAQQFSHWLKIPNPSNYGEEYRLAPPEPVPSPDTGPGWRTGEPETDGPYWCEIQLGEDIRRQGLRWSKEQGWLFLNVNAVISVPVLRWYPLPKEDEK